MFGPAPIKALLLHQSGFFELGRETSRRVFLFQFYLLYW